MASDWVRTEIAKARKREAQKKRQMLFPVTLAPYDPVIRDLECFNQIFTSQHAKDGRKESSKTLQQGGTHEQAVPVISYIPRNDVRADGIHLPAACPTRIRPTESGCGGSPSYHEQNHKQGKHSQSVHRHQLQQQNRNLD